MRGETPRRRRPAPVLVTLALLIAVLAGGAGTAPALAGDDSGRPDIADTSGATCFFDCDAPEQDETDDDSLPEKLRLYDEKGRRSGKVERDPLFEDRLRIYDEKGRRAGRVEKDPIFRDRLRTYDERGRRTGYIQADPIFEDRWRIYDERGRKVGEVRRNPIFEDRYDIYDENGRRTGRAEDPP